MNCSGTRRICDRIGCYALLFPLAGLAGCGSPLLAYSTDRPAAIQVSLQQAGMTDGRAGFRATFCALVARDLAGEDADCDRWLTTLSDDPSGHGKLPASLPELAPTVDIVLVNGIFGECLGDKVTLFGDSLGQLSRAGYRISHVPVHGRAGSEANAEIIRAHVMKQHEMRPQRKSLILGYSKGASDTLTALSKYPEMAPHVAAVLSVAGVVNGSPLADKLAGVYGRVFSTVPYGACPINDQDEIESLTRKRRFDWVAHNALPKTISYFSIVATPHPDKVSRGLQPFYRRLSFVDPLNDGQLIFYDAVIPGSRVLAYMNADHWAIALPFEYSKSALFATFINTNHFPRAQMLEAAVREVETVLSAKDTSDSAVRGQMKGTAND